ncbi:hypothetical protein Tco_0693951 [Tanacetum coccineum]
MPYPPVGYDVSNLLLRQRIDCCSLNNVSVLPNNTAYSVYSIRHTILQYICAAYSNQLNMAYQSPDIVAELKIDFRTRSSTKELITPFENPERVFRLKRRLFETPGLVESSSPEFDLFSDIEEHSEEEETT